MLPVICRTRGDVGNVALPLSRQEIFSQCWFDICVKGGASLAGQQETGTAVVNISTFRRHRGFYGLSRGLTQPVYR